MLTLICPHCGGAMETFPRCRCGRSVPCEGGVYQFTRQPSSHLTGPGPHYLGYGSWGRASATPYYYPICSARLAELLEPQEWCVDVGTGYGQVPLQLAAAGARTLAVDISNTALWTLRARSVAAGVKEKIFCARMDAYHLSVADGSAAVVLLNSIFPMLDRPELALREAARVLRPGGHMVLYGRRTIEEKSGEFQKAERMLFATFEKTLTRWGWSQVWFGGTGEGEQYPYFQPPVCLSAGPPIERTERLWERLRRLEENGFNRYQHIPRAIYRRAWAETREQLRRTFGPRYGDLAYCRVEEPVLYLYEPEAEL